MEAEVLYYRRVMDLSELALCEVKEFGSKSQMMKHIRATKKRIAEECKYRFPRDNVYYLIKERSI